MDYICIWLYVQGAIKKSPKLISQYWKRNINLKAPHVFFYFLGTNNILRYHIGFTDLNRLILCKWKLLHTIGVRKCAIIYFIHLCFIFIRKCTRIYYYIYFMYKYLLYILFISVNQQTNCYNRERLFLRKIFFFKF